MFLYINGMVADMKMRMLSMEGESPMKPRRPLNKLQKWSIYEREINFHNEIVGYLRKSSKNHTNIDDKFKFFDEKFEL